MDLHLPEAKKVTISFDTYKKLVEDALEDGGCNLCCVCGEPIWVLEPGRHKCWEVSTDHYTTVNVAQELSELSFA